MSHSDEVTLRAGIGELLEGQQIACNPTDPLDRARLHEKKAENHDELAWIYALLEDQPRAQDHLKEAEHNRRWARDYREEAARGKIMSVAFTPPPGKSFIRLVSPNPAPRFLPNLWRPLPRPRETRRAPSLRRRRSGLVRGPRSPGRAGAADPDPASHRVARRGRGLVRVPGGGA